MTTGVGEGDQPTVATTVRATPARRIGRRPTRSDAALAGNAASIAAAEPTAATTPTNEFDSPSEVR